MAADLVHVIDDDEAVRDSVAALLEAAGLTTLTYPSAAQFLAGLEAASSGCVVTDVRMPEMSGLDLLRGLEARRSEFPTIVLTGEADVPTAVEALKVGALDFIEKPFAPDAILTAVRAALGRLHADGARAAVRADGAQRLAALSAREREVLEGLLAGAANKQIARDLGISPRTVEAYRANLMMKMEAQTLSDLIRIALRAKG